MENEAVQMKGDGIMEMTHVCDLDSGNVLDRITYKYHFIWVERMVAELSRTKHFFGLRPSNLFVTNSGRLQFVPYTF